MRDQYSENGPELWPSANAGSTSDASEFPDLHNEKSATITTPLVHSCPPPVENSAVNSTGQLDPVREVQRPRISLNWFIGLNICLSLGLIGLLSLAFVTGRLDEITTIFLGGLIAAVSNLGLWIFHRWLIPPK